MLLGVIADDMTGATDVALMLNRAGMRTVQVIGVPAQGVALPEADAVVVALKSRTNPVAEAVADSLAACEALLAAGARQILFKYCSTFDSTAEGNIGPVANALMQRLGAKLAIVCPAFPANGRSIYQGYLFVGAVPLHESSMKDHPLTPMRDSNLMRLMAAQAKTDVGLVDYATVLAGPSAVKARLAKLEVDGVRYAVTDALTNEDLMTLGHAVSEHVLLTGGSGIAMGLPQNFRRAGLLPERPGPQDIKAPSGRAGIISGIGGPEPLYLRAMRRGTLRLVLAGGRTLLVNTHRQPSARVQRRSACEVARVLAPLLSEPPRVAGCRVASR